MKKTFAFILSMLAVSLLAGNVDMKKIEDSRLFDVDYRKLHYSGHADAQFAKGSPKGRILHELRPRYDVEAMESINRGLMVGEGCASVRYKSAGNLNPVNGSIEIVFTNYAWNWNEPGVHIFMQCLGKESTLYLYKHNMDGVGSYVASKDPKWSLFPRVMLNKLKGNTPNHMVLTYSPESVRLYFNGLLVRETTPGGPIKEWHKSFEIGPTGKFGRQSRTTIASVTTYDRPLAAEEILALAASKVPTLDLAGAKVVEPVMLPGSTFLKNPGKCGIEALEDDYVVSPWTPVEYRDGVFNVWNREYDFTTGALLGNVLTPDGKLLRDGLNLVVVKDGQKAVVEFAKKFELQKDAKGRKSFYRAVVAPHYLKGGVLTTVEYDGTVDYAFDLKGIDKLEKINLVAPMDGEYSEIVHYVGTTGMTMRSIVAPDVSYSKTLDKAPGVVFARDFLPHIWVGSPKGGLQISHNSDKPFYPKDRKDCFRVVRQSTGEVDIDIPYAVEKTPAKDGKIEFDFTVIATPVRPMPENWRAWNFSAQYDGFVGNRRGSHLIYWPDGWGCPITLDPDPHRGTKIESNRECIAMDRADNRKIIPYFDHRHVGARENNIVNPDTKYIMENWAPIPFRPPSGSQREYVRVFSETGYTDYLARCVYEYSKLMGTIDGVYIDEMENIPNLRKETNGGYEDYDGKRRPTYGIPGDRKMYKRLDAVVRAQNGGAMPMNIAHCSATHMMSVLSHFPIFLTAEHLYSGYFPDNKELIPPEGDRLYYYSYALPMDRVKSEFYHRPWGSVIAFLPCLKNQRDIMNKVEPTRDLLSRVMHADVLFWPLWCNRDEMYKVEDFRRKWDIGNKAVKFIPYWENKEVTSATPDSCISYYDKNGEKLAIVSNLARVAQEMVVDLPAGTREVINAETDEKLPVSGNQVKIQMKRNDYCALIIKK